MNFLNNILKRVYVYIFYTNINLKKSNILHSGFKIVQKDNHSKVRVMTILFKCLHLRELTKRSDTEI